MGFVLRDFVGALVNLLFALVSALCLLVIWGLLGDWFDFGLVMCCTIVRVFGGLDAC